MKGICARFTTGYHRFYYSGSVMSWGWNANVLLFGLEKSEDYPRNGNYGVLALSVHREKAAKGSIEHAHLRIPYFYVCWIQFLLSTKCSWFLNVKCFEAKLTYCIASNITDSHMECKSPHHNKLLLPDDGRASRRSGLPWIFLQIGAMDLLGWQCLGFIRS